MSHTSACLIWEGARNLGDLGGLPLRTGGRTALGRVFRSAAPEWMTRTGWRQARAAGVATVIDLRNEMERGRSEQHPVVHPSDLAGVTVVRTPSEDPDDVQFRTECGPWLDHPRSWTPNLRLHPDLIAQVFTAIADADEPLLIHCSGGRDRTGLIGSMVLALAEATPEAIVANYEAGFRGASQHRGHAITYSATLGAWVTTDDERWTEAELDAALADRRDVVLDWADSFDVAGYLTASGVSGRHLGQLRHLLRD